MKRLNLKLIRDQLKNYIRQYRIKRNVKRFGLEKYDNIEDLFSDYYRNRVWSGGKEETASGSGSTLRKTELLRNELPKLLDKYGVKTIFDAPCGDYNWFRHVDRGSIKYIGGDIVKALIEDNDKYADQDTAFIHFDIIKDEFPAADIWFCRDVLLHLPYDMIFELLQNFARSDVPYLLVSTYYSYAENMDIPAGTGRPINLEIKPFNLPPPDDYVKDDVTGRNPKIMGLWKRETIANIVLQQENR
jgi:hypothetical protein